MSETYRRWVLQSYDEALTDTLKGKPDAIRQAINNNPRKGVFIDRLIREVKKCEGQHRLDFLEEHRIKAAVKDFCKFHFECIFRSLEKEFRDQIVQKEAEQAGFKIDEQTGLECLDD